MAKVCKDQHWRDHDRKEARKQKKPLKNGKGPNNHNESLTRLR